MKNLFRVLGRIGYLLLWCAWWLVLVPIGMLIYGMIMLPVWIIRILVD